MPLNQEQDPVHQDRIDLEEDDDKSGDVKIPSNHKKTQVIIGVVLVVITVAVIWFISQGGNKDKEAVADQPQASITADGQTVVTEPGKDQQPTVNSDKPWLTDAGATSTQPTASTNVSVGKSDDKNSGIGIKDISGDTVKVNPHNISSKDLTKSFDGKPVEKKYQVIKITTAPDFISYTLNRSVTDQGIEMYWLNAVYKGKKAIIPVPFSIAKEMDPVGTTVADVEITDTVDTEGNITSIVTGFTVRTDYKQLIEGR